MKMKEIVPRWLASLTPPESATAESNLEMKDLQICQISQYNYINH